MEGKLIFRAKCTSENFGLSYYLFYLAKSFLSFFFLCVYTMFLGFLSMFTLLLKKPTLLCVSNFVLIIPLSEKHNSW